ncbi:MAG TPA: sigma-70 family RNA polymerase sigma factor [Gemmataceae bacterium]|jgi:RNA polymerase sigma-70 factor (ECF subfamily)|nr:sigma-70 family RNA polymerase sigma factor [Gemmataceae bacterium]
MGEEVPFNRQAGTTAAPPDSEPSDRSLLRRFRGGQPDAATELYLRYAERLRALAARQCAPDLAPRLDPDDIVQSVFRTFFRRVAQGQYNVPEGEDLWKLFMIIALHKVRSAATFHRAAKRDVRATATGLSDEISGENLVARDGMALATLRMVIDEVLDALPPSMRSIVESRIEGYEVEEIARRTQRSRRSVERALQEFRARLSPLIREDV